MNESASPALVPLHQSWPPALVARYRAAGYWRGETLPGVLRERATRDRKSTRLNSSHWE